MISQLETKLSRLQHDIRYQLIILAAVTLLASILRFYKLGQWSFWGDEFITVRNALNMGWESAITRPISLILTKVFIEAAGVSEATARIASASIGVVTIPVLFFYSRKMTNSSVALIASLLLAVAPWHIYWSQSARFYTALLLFFTMALYFFYLALEHDRIIYLLFSMVFLFLSLQERMLGAFFVPIVVIYVVLLKVLPFQAPPGLRWRNLAVFFLPGFIGAAYLILTQSTIRDPSRWINLFGFVNNSPLWLLGGFVFYLGIPVVCLAAIGSIRLLSKWNRLGLMLSLAAALPIMAIVIISFFQYTANRYAFISVTSIVLLAAITLDELIVALKGSVKSIAFAVVVIVLLSGLADNFLYFQYQNGNRDNWKGALEFIAREMTAEDQVAAVDIYLAEFYLQHSVIDLHYLEQVGADLVTQNQGSTWFLLDLTAPDKTPQTTKWVREHARFVRDFDVVVGARRFPMEIYLYTAPIP
jgi:mannosyltransferase